MPEAPRPPEPRTIDAGDEHELRKAAEELRSTPEIIAEAIDKVGPNRIAVELYLAAPRA